MVIEWNHLDTGVPKTKSAFLFVSVSSHQKLGSEALNI